MVPQIHLVLYPSQSLHMLFYWARPLCACMPVHTHTDIHTCQANVYLLFKTQPTHHLLSTAFPQTPTAPQTAG